MPEDKEELALTLNGKKRKINRDDFESAFSKSGLDKKVAQTIFDKFEKVIPEWKSFIETSFLNAEMQHRYAALIDEKGKVLYG
ncbi:hypothetical protein FACS189411_03840 [Bacteroidia bacterium]|nr:hypothetical protein FACS189411_03840 [Bacteroidia bacterium]